jgi:hypothetical protein
MTLQITNHLKKCVESTPELAWLPEETAQRVVASVCNGNPSRATLPKGLGRIPTSEDPGDAQRLTNDEDSFDPKEMAHVPEKLHHQWMAFSKRQTQRLRAHSDFDHAINIEEGRKIPNLPIYNLSRRELDILREYLDTAQEKG